MKINFVLVSILVTILIGGAFGLIEDTDFVSGIQYLITNGIMHV